MSETEKVPLYVKLEKDDAELLDKMVPLLYHYKLIPVKSKKAAVSFSIRTTALLLKRVIESGEIEDIAREEVTKE